MTIVPLKQHRWPRHIGHIAVGMVFFISTITCIAAPADFRVLTDDIAVPGETNLEWQLGHARQSNRFTDSVNPAWQGLFELANGILPQWEASVQIPVVRNNISWRVAGLNAELQYVAPHHQEENFYWGLRGEIAYVNPVDGSRAWQTEWRPILGYRRNAWHAVLNLGLMVPVTGHNQRGTFEPSAKLTRNIDERSAVSVEYFVEAGPFAHLYSHRLRNELALAVVDTKVGNADVNIGIGKGLTASSDRWVAKIVLSFALGD